MQRNAPKSAADILRESAQRAQYSRLTAHYGEIGSAALNAALLHAKCRKGKMLEQAADTGNRVSG